MSGRRSVVATVLAMSPMSSATSAGGLSKSHGGGFVNCDGRIVMVGVDTISHDAPEFRGGMRLKAGSWRLRRIVVTSDGGAWAGVAGGDG